MSDDSLLRKEAHSALQAGELPKRAPDRIWGGLATGGPCAICGRTMVAGDVALELEFTRDSDGSRATYHVHPGCYTSFNFELRGRAGRITQSGTSQAAAPRDDKVRQHDTAS